MEYKIYINGKIFNEDEAKISVLDRGVICGDSIYEVFRSYDGRRIFLLDEHLERLKTSALYLRFNLPNTLEYIKDELERCVQEAGFKKTYIRLIITRGIGDINLDFTDAKRPSMIIIMKEFHPFPDEYYRNGIDLKIVSIRRNPIDSFNPGAKSGNYLNSALAYNEAKTSGFHDALLLNHQNFCTESSTSNFFFVQGDTLYTPSLDMGILSGITRNFIIRLAHDTKIPVQEGAFTRQDLSNADECFISSTLKEIMPVKSIDHEKEFLEIPGIVTRKLQDTFRNTVKKYYEGR